MRLFFVAIFLLIFAGCGGYVPGDIYVEYTPSPVVPVICYDDVDLPLSHIEYFPAVPFIPCTIYLGEDCIHYFEIYEIKGTAASLTGIRWDSMRAWRENARHLADLHRGVVFVNKDPADSVVFLTFDDGPDPVNTVSVINTLKEYGVSGTFFFTRENIRRFPDVVRMTYEAGFPIGLHSYSHPHFTNLSAEEIIDELNRTNDELERITGSRATIMRPPYGSLDEREIAIINEMDLAIYLWSLDTLDWAQSDANEILRNVQDYLRPGEIILMHAFSGQAMSAAVLPQMIEFILEMGFEIKGL